MEEMHTLEASPEEYYRQKRMEKAAQEMYDELYGILQFMKVNTTWDDDDFSLYAKDIEGLFAFIDGEEAQ